MARSNRASARPRVLMLAHHFPPIGGVVGRNVATARFLPELGYDPVVVTGPARDGDRWAPRDDALVERVGDVAVRRAPGPVPPPLGRLRTPVARWAERPAPWVRWWVDAAVATALPLAGEVDAILANLIPYETAEAADALARELGVPWVADLEDPWALDEMRVHPTALNRRIDRRRMRRGLASAAALIMSCPEAAARVRREMPQWDDKIVTAIPHGFTCEDFEGPAPIRDDDAFRIVHTGSLHTALGRDHRRSRRLRAVLGGTSLDVDILTRSPVHLVEAIDRLALARPDLARRIDLHLAGRLTAADREALRGYAPVHAHGQLSHPDTVALARSADLLFVPMHDLPRGRRAGLVPCKAYEYLAARRPVLAAVPDGDARDLLGRFARVSLCRPADARCMAAAIARRMERGGADVAPTAAEEELLATYERRHLTARIAGVLDAVLGRDGVSAPGPGSTVALSARRRPSGSACARRASGA